MSPASSPNVFQRLTRRWAGAHPYVAAQVMALTTEAIGFDWESAWRATARSWGIGGVVWTGKRFRHEPPPENPGIGLVRRELPRPLEQIIEDGLNGGPSDTTDEPFRPFIVESSSHVCLGILYDHWAADSVSIRMLMREWLDRATGRWESDRAAPARARAGGYAKYFGPQTGHWRPADLLLDTARFLDRMRRVRSRKVTGDSPWRTGFFIERTQSGVVDRLRNAAHAAGATVNDLIVAAAMESVATRLPIPAGSKRRRQWAVGSIVDLRAFDARLKNIFGNFLGFTAAFAGPADIADWDRLVATIARQSRQAKQTGAAAGSGLLMGMTLAAGRVLNDRKFAYFCRLHAPLTAGVSNVNLTRQWPENSASFPIVDWIRASPPGPMAPIVFAVTSIGNELTIGVSFRASIVDRAEARQATMGLIERLNAL